MNGRMLGATLGAVALVGGAVVAAAPSATAIPGQQEGKWHIQSPTSSHEVVGAWFVLRYYVEINFVPTNIECRIPPGLLSHTIATGDLDPVDAEETIELAFIPPAIISDSGDAPGASVCQDVTLAPYGSGQNLDVTTDGVMTWTMEITAPAAPMDDDPKYDPMDTAYDPVYDGTMMASVGIPQDGIDLVDPSIGCRAQAPATSGGVTIDGEYDASTGEMTPDTPQGFVAYSPDSSCVVENAELVAGTNATLDPILTLQWVPDEE